MTSKTTTKSTSPKTSRKSSQQQPRKKHSLKHSVKHSVKKSNRINRQRRLQKQLQILLLERHSRRCIICHHPEREAIEEEFVHWRAPWKLAQDYKLADCRNVYRHARAAGLLLQRRERLHSALDAFVESVDDVTFTGDTILRAMRAYSCIDSHGRLTEIPTQVQFSTSIDGPPPQHSPRTSDVSSDVIDIDPDEEPEEEEENAFEERVTASDVLDVVRKYSNQASRSDATACAASSAQASNAPEDEYDEQGDDDSDADEESEEDAENALEELTSLSTSSKSSSRNNTACSTFSNSMSRSDSTACAASPAQSHARGASVASDVLDVVPKYSNDASRSDATACAASPAQSASGVRLNSQSRGRTVTATPCAVPPAQALNVTEDEYDEPDGDDSDDKPEYELDDEPDNDVPNHDVPNNDSKNKSDAHRLEETTTCAVSPAQALPRDVVRGQNPNDRLPSDRTDCAASPAQPAAPPKPKPDADGFIWHPRPGYPDQEISEPDAQGRVAYKIHMTTAASQLPSRQTDAQRAAELIYRSVIKKYGNP